MKTVTVSYARARPAKDAKMFICPECRTAEWHRDPGGHPLFCIRLSLHEDMGVREMRPANQLELAEAKSCPKGSTA